MQDKSKHAETLAFEVIGSAGKLILVRLHSSIPQLCQRTSHHPQQLPQRPPAAVPVLQQDNHVACSRRMFLVHASRTGRLCRMPEHPRQLNGNLADLQTDLYLIILAAIAALCITPLQRADTQGRHGEATLAQNGCVGSGCCNPKVVSMAECMSSQKLGIEGGPMSSKRGTVPVTELALQCVVSALRRTQQRRLPCKPVAERLPVPKAWVWAWQTWQPMTPWQ